MVTNLGRKLLRVQICFLVSLFPLLASLTCAQVRKELLGLSQRVCTKPSLRSVCRWGIVSSRKSTGGSKSASKIAAYLRVAKTRKRV